MDKSGRSRGQCRPLLVDPSCCIHIFCLWMGLAGSWPVQASFLLDHVVSAITCACGNVPTVCARLRLQAMQFNAWEQAEKCHGKMQMARQNLSGGPVNLHLT